MAPSPTEAGSQPAQSPPPNESSPPQSSGDTIPASDRNPNDLERDRKRARDRRSQQAMRDRTKYTINSLTSQVHQLTSTLDSLTSKVAFLETENTQLRTQNAALQLSLLGRRGSQASHYSSPNAASPAVVPAIAAITTPVWELPPNNTSPVFTADDIIQKFIIRTRSEIHDAVPSNRPNIVLGPNLRSLLDREHQSDDATSNIVAGVLWTYKEIEGLPKQVAVFDLMVSLVKWLVLLDKKSWDVMPSWLRPVPSQLSIPHAPWIDRIPWPSAREYLIAHPSISLDDFAAPYSSGFDLNWPYDPSSVLLSPTALDTPGAEVAMNPVYVEHARQIKNWTVGKAFRLRFPELSTLIDIDTGVERGETTSPGISDPSHTSPF